MQRKSITVYANPLSPYVNKVRAFLNLKGLAYEVIYVDPVRQKEELAFSGQAAVPVVTVGEEILIDSTPICVRLDELLPEERQVIPDEPDLREKLLGIDRWVSDELIPTGFFTSQHLPLLAKLRNGWLSGQIHSTTAPGKIPFWMQLLWPIFVVRANFVSPLIQHLDPSLTAAEIRQKAAREFVEKLEEGPFLGGQRSPSLPDCAAYGHFVPCYMGGMRGYDEFVQFPQIRSWAQRMTPLVHTPQPFWPSRLVRRAPELL